MDAVQGRMHVDWMAAHPATLLISLNLAVHSLPTLNVRTFTQNEHRQTTESQTQNSNQYTPHRQPQTVNHSTRKPHTATHCQQTVSLREPIHIHPGQPR